MVALKERMMNMREDVKLPLGEMHLTLRTRAN